MTWQPAELGAISIVDGIVVVEHGGDANFARPAAAVVYWKGSVDPVNAIDGDIWYETAGS